MKSNCAVETEDFGRVLGASLLPGTVVALSGDLGAGKTTLIKGIISGLSKEPILNITSPTFNYVNTYDDYIHHFDLYRIKDAEDFIARGFRDYFDETSVCCIEWAEKIATLLPKDTLFVSLQYSGENRRTISIKENA